MDFTKDIATLSQMLNNGVFRKHIHYIRYPKFRNLEPNTKITFDFPITFFVGKNGGGKSSTLQSLYGAPLNKSLSDYWFSTAIDPITELKENRNCFIYGYDVGGKIGEVLKQRAQRKNKLDYWEPSKPVKKYSMESTRYSPIERAVFYVDFRSELSAFDSFMYFMPFDPSTGISSKQDYIRRYSGKIKEAFDTKKVINHFRIDKNKPAISLSDEEVGIISNILGKTYSTIEILDHKFLKNWGFSVRLTSPNLKYSEAFAGSGETAVIVLVHKIHNCPPDSLILLDEPETSLHFGAQKRLTKYLLQLCKERQIQLVISTHSPFFLEGMPSKAIKVFSQNNIGLFHVENERKPQEALIELEIDSEKDKRQILVEDELAKKILESALSTLGEDVKNAFNISFLPGGSDSLKQRMAYLIGVGEMPFIVFDGDQKIIDTHIDLDTYSLNEINTFKKLSKLLQKQTKGEINFFSDGGNHDNEEQKIELIKEYFRFYQSNVFYLPKSVPEEVIWSDEYATKKLKLLFEDDQFNLDEIKTGSSKEWFCNLTNKIYGSLEFMDAIESEFILDWIRLKNDDYQSILNTLQEIRNK